MSSSNYNQQQQPAGKKKNGSEHGSLFDFEKQTPKALGSVGDDDANFGSPTSSQFVKRDPKNRKKANSMKPGEVIKRGQPGTLDSHTVAHQETLEEALVDLYLSVKIRSNDEVSEQQNHHTSLNLDQATELTQSVEQKC